MKRTKIIATLGPATESKAVIEKMVDAGLNIARLNFSHGTEEQFKKIAKNVREVEAKTGHLLTIMQDLQGPKIRLGQIPGDKMFVQRGEEIVLSTKAGEPNTIHVPYPALPQVVKKNHALLIEDGLIRTKVISVKDHHVKVRIVSGGYLKNHKGVNIPDSTLPPSAALTAKDRKDLEFGVKVLKVDAIAISFVEKAEDVERVRREVAKHSKRKVFLVAKIERREALNNLEAIIQAADGVMVARGDLGIEIPAEKVPIVQRQIITLARQAGKPVIIATQILQSMVSSPLATRAEVSDAATAIFEQSDAFMLSNETAVGEFPVQAVKTLARVAKTTEKEIFRTRELTPVANIIPDLIEDDSIALNACVVAENIRARAIIVMTKEGHTARTVIKNRPKIPVIVLTPTVEAAHQLNFLWGIERILIQKGPYHTEDAKAFLKKQKILQAGDQVVFVKLTDNKRSLVAMTV